MPFAQVNGRDDLRHTASTALSLAADEAEIGGARMIQSAGRAASIVAILWAALAIWWALGLRESLLATPLLALPLGWMLPSRTNVGSTAINVIEWIIVPAVSAFVVMKIDAIEDFAIWPIVVAALVCGDGRWFGATLGALLPGGRRVLRTMRLVLGSMAAGPTQLAVTALGVHTGILSPSTSLALLIGAAVIEMSVPLRRRLAVQMETLEAELDEDAMNDA